MSSSEPYFMQIKIFIMTIDFRSFSRPRAQGKPQLKVKLMIFKILKLFKCPQHPTFQFEATK